MSQRISKDRSFLWERSLNIRNVNKKIKKGVLTGIKQLLEDVKRMLAINNINFMVGI